MAGRDILNGNSDLLGVGFQQSALVVKVGDEWPSRPQIDDSVMWIGGGSPDPTYTYVGDVWLRPDGSTLVTDGLHWTTNVTTTDKPARDQWLQPFVTTSPWNLPKATAAVTLDPNSHAVRSLRANNGPDGTIIVPYINNDSISGFTHPMYRAGIDDPYVDVWDEGHSADNQFSIGAHSGYRMPVDALPSKLTDAAMCVVTPDGRWGWDTGKLSRVSDTKFMTDRPYRNVVVNANQPTFNRGVIQNVDTVTNEIVSQGHGLSTGAAIVFTATPPAPLLTGTIYYAIKTAFQRFKVATSAANATAGTAIDLTDAGSGSTWSPVTISADSTQDSFNAPNHTLATGTPIYVAGTTPTNLAPNQTVYAIKVDANNFKVATSIANAKAGTAIDLQSNVGGMTFRAGEGSLVVFNWFATDSVNDAGTNANPYLDEMGNLKRGKSYYMRDVTDTTFALSETPGGSAIVPTVGGQASIQSMSQDGTVQTNTSVSKIDLYGTGWGSGARSANTVTIGGMIRAHEVETGVIPHALAITLFGDYQLKERANGNNSAYVYPATSQDAAGKYGYRVTVTLDAMLDTLTSPNHGLEVGDAIKANATGNGFTSGQFYWVTTVIDANNVKVSAAFGGSSVDISAGGTLSFTFYGGVPMGAYVVLGNDFNLTQMDTKAGRMLATCYRDYGAFVVDSGGSFAMATIDHDVPRWFTDDLLATRNGTTYAELKKIRDALLIVDPTTMAAGTPNGGALDAIRNAPLAGELRV